jgi:hypothetical protein
MTFWQELAVCTGDDNPEWLGEVITVDCATACLVCPVRLECLTEALPRDRHWDAGIWGGTTVADRDNIRRNKDTVAHIWRRLELLVKERHGGRHGGLDSPSGLLSEANR